MLSLPDADLVRRDPSLPGLPLLLDPEAFTAALRPHLPAVTLGKAEVGYLRYKPGTSCLAEYRIDAGGQPLRLHAKCFARGADVKIEKRRERKGDADRCVPGRIALEDLATIVFFFPDDPELGRLHELADPAARTNRLKKLLPTHPGLWDGEVRTLAYKPERRFVGRLLGRGEESAVLKYYAGPEFETALRNARSFHSRGTLRIARCIGKSDRRRILVLEWLDGRLLSDLLAAPAPEDGAAARAGRALAEFHGQRVEGLTVTARAEEGGRLLELAAGIGWLRPRLGGKATALARRIAGMLPDGPPADRAVHGDFYAKQVLVGENGAALLDLDRAARGEAASDLGRFIAHLESDAVRGRIPPRNVAPAAEELLSGYGEVAPIPAPTMVSLHAAAALFGLAMDPFRLREPDWPERIEALLDRAAAVMPREGGANPATSPGLSGTDGEADAAAGIPVSDPLNAAADPGMPRLREALDPARVGVLFTRALGTPSGPAERIVPLAVRVVRHKPGRRCLVEYDLRVETAGVPAATLTVLGKVRAKGPDRSAFRLLEALRDGGFGEDSPDGVSVPEPLGVVPELDMWVQRKAPGVPSARPLAEPGGTAIAERIAGAIHKVHRASLSPRRRHGMTEELGILRERLNAAALAHPRRAERIERVYEACARLGASVPAPMPCGIHRDFHPDQVLLDGERLYLLDFDLFSEGDPALDVGNFAAHLTELALRTLGGPDALADREAALIDRFLSLAGARHEPGVRAYAVLTLARHIFISTLFPERRPFTGPLLDLCEERLGIANRPAAL